MPFVAVCPEQYFGQIVGSGQCVDFVRTAMNGLPPTNEWFEGRRVWQAGWLASGTAIATFGPDGRYKNQTDGSSHAAIFLDADEKGGITVLDQWINHPVARRVIRAKGGKGPPCDDADAFAVIETASPEA
jgi:hypothetical protein